MANCPLGRCLLWTMVCVALGPGSWALAGETVSTWRVGAPIVTYWCGPLLTDVVARQAIKGGYNLVLSWGTSTIPVAQPYGLRTLLWKADLLVPSSLDNPKKLAQLNALIDKFKASPAAYAYYIADEPDVKQFADLGRLVAHIRQRDPSHLCYINLPYNWSSPAQLGCADYTTYLDRFISVVHPSLLCFDHYYLMKKGDEQGFLLNLEQIAGRAQANGLPFMAVVQACSQIPGARVPTANELRSIVYTTLAYGSQGISYYIYNPGDPRMGGLAPYPDGKPTSVYEALTPLNKQFVAIARQLQPLKRIGTYLQGYRPGAMPPGAVAVPSNASFRFSDVPDTSRYANWAPLKGVLLGCFGPDTQLGNTQYVLVENNDYANSLTTTVTGPGNLSIFDTTSGTWTATGSRSHLLHLPEGGGILVGLTSAVPAGLRDHTGGAARAGNDVLANDSPPHL